MTVLVADDNEVAQRLLRRVLERAGHKVLMASDGLEAVSLALANSPDVIVMDIAMPVMDGLEATRQIKKQRPGIAIVIASVLATESNRERFLAAGADEVMKKPLRLADLLAAVTRVTANRGPQISPEARAKDVLPPSRTLAGPARIFAGAIMAIAAKPWAMADIRRRKSLKNHKLEFAMQALDARDRYMASHSMRVGELAASIGRHLGLGHREVELLRTAGSLHDLGMIGVRDDVLNKPLPLNDEEWELIRRHPDIGADLLAQHPDLAEVAPIVRHHHERRDGTGYPAGLKGTVIPLGAQIIAVAEAFDTMTSGPIYRRSLMTPTEALEELSRRANHWYDPEVVNALREIQGLSPLE